VFVESQSKREIGFFAKAIKLLFTIDLLIAPESSTKAFDEEIIERYYD
jgi:hypothetical protein